MGADIHYVLERRSATGEWYGTYSTGGIVRFPPYRSPAFEGSFGTINPFGILKQRDYDFFGRIASVRGDGQPPLGIPNDISTMTREAIDYWGGDGHSHSYMSLREFVLARLAVHGDVGEQAKKILAGKDIVLDFLSSDTCWIEQEEIKDFRVVFWFDS